MQLVLVCLLMLGGAHSSYAEVLISGVDAKLSKNIIAYLVLNDEPCDAPAWRVRRLFSDAVKEIRGALEVEGYYDVEIEKKLETGATCWQASFTITLGQPVVLHKVLIEINTDDTQVGMQDTELEKAVRDCALRSGDILQHANYDACTRRIARIARERGYFDAEFIEHRIDVYPDQYTADITIYFKTGPRYVFGITSFEQDVLDPDLVQRFINITQGEPYDATLVRRLKRDLITSAYFDQVEFTPSPSGDPYFDVPMHVELTAGKKYQYDAGIGFATDVGPKLRLGVLNRRVNSKGHNIEFEINTSKVISDIGLTYRIPLDKLRDWFTIDTFYKYEDNDSFISELFSAGIQRIQKRDNGWIRTLFLNLRLEQYETGVTDDGYSELLTPGISYAFVEEDYPPRPLSGHRSSVLTRGALNGAISDTSFLQIHGSTKWVFGLWPGARLLPRAEVGATLIDELDTLPVSVRFYAGGDTSVRGYAYNSLGPTDEFGAVAGGENLLVGSIEVDQQIFTDWSVAAFVDSGNAYDALKDFNPATGVGAGIRWFSPLGPIRFDIAVPLEADAPDDYRVHITLGPDL